MSIDGTPKFGTIAVKEITADITASTLTLSCKAAFVDRTSGSTHGWTWGEGGIWSQETKDRLRALQESMENDLARLHFQEGGEMQVTRHSAQPQLGGIAEHLEDADQA